jgi:hypothetical protein
VPVKPDGRSPEILKHQEMEADAVEKSDYRKELKHLYNPSQKEIGIVDVPVMDFLMIDGQGDPSTSREYQAAVEGLFTVSYALKFMVKRGEQQVDYSVFPLEGLWWADDLSAFALNNRNQWKWTAMIAQPRWVNRDLFGEAVKDVERRKHLTLPTSMRFKTFHEGRAAQVMYIGPFAEEGRTITKIHGFIGDMACELSGKHHEIYMSDFRKTPPEKLKTIIRQPFKTRT